MSEAVRRRIFEPFFSTKGEAGSGLGLAMAYSIARRHGGDIRVESAPGQGARFTLSFPAMASATNEADPARTAAAGRRARVLVVDDDPQVLATLAEILRSLGHSVVPVPGGAAGLAAHAPGRFDVVLTNLGMVGMNGWEFAERLRARDPAVGLVFITGWGLRDEDMSRLTGLDVRRCLFKPVRPPDLDAAIQEALVTP
jgi:CheY-like chemotaxis protein